MNWIINGHSVLEIVLVTFLVSVFLVPIAKKIAHHVGAIDMPNAEDVGSGVDTVKYELVKDGEVKASLNVDLNGSPRRAAAVAGVDFIKLIENNLKGIENSASFGDYDEGIVMMMYDSVVIKKKEELV